MPEAPPPTGGTLPSGTLTRGKAAEALGVSRTTLRRMEGTELHPRRGANGVRLFDATEVQEVVRRTRTRMLSPRAAEVDGEVAANVYAALEAGEDPVQVVIAQRVDPRIMVDLLALRAKLRGGLWMSPDTRRALAAPDLLGAEPATEADLLDAVRRAAAPPRCSRCRRAPAIEGPCPKCRKAIRAEKVWTG